MKKDITKLNAVIGYPLEHSKSPILHNPVYEMLKLNSVLLPFSDPDVKALVSAIRTLGIRLSAVTMPFKQSIIPLLDRVDTGAKKIKAVNTVLNKKGKLYGYNTDIYGIEYALRNTKLKNRNVLIIGAGGAASAVAYVIQKAGGNLIYLNRTKKRARDLQKVFGGLVVTQKELVAEGVDVIVNATPRGMYPNVNDIPISPGILHPHQTVFDLVYNPIDTKLLKLAKNMGANAISGLDMFALQGLRQIELLVGKKLITKALVEKVKKNLIKTL